VDVSRTLDAALLARWAAAAVAALEGHRAEIDRINVFPVADRDTGTNMLLTMRAAAAGAVATTCSSPLPRPSPAARCSARAATPG
jgi:dihydroxyacetone kinase-like predicted kinase